MSGLTSVKGIHVIGKHCGIKPIGKRDLAVIYSEKIASAAGVFTTNKVKGAPVILSIERLEHTGKAQAIVINSGNSNVCTGEQGYKDAVTMAQLTADELSIDEKQVLVSSTGIIGFPLPMDKIAHGLKGIGGILKKSESQTSLAAEQAAEAIMTTDTTVKQISATVGKCTIGAMAKGSGMIHPNMATMLAFIATDAAYTAEQLQAMLKKSVDKSFNMIAVDNDTSTSDSVYLLANGMNGSVDEQEFQKALDYVCIELAKMIARDGEGATKLMEVVVRGASDECAAKTIAKSVVQSYLVKSAFGVMPIFGRVMAAVGYSGVEINPNTIDISFGDECVVNKGLKTLYDKQRIQKILSKDHITIFINLHDGESTATAWGCDLTEKYVQINAGYYT